MMGQGTDRQPTGRASRRAMLRGASGAPALGSVELVRGARAAAQGSSPASKNGRIRQSIVHWCFEKYWDIPQTIQVAKQLGCTSIELIDPKYFPLLKQA